MTDAPALPTLKNLRVLCFDDKKSQRDATRALLEEQAPITVDFAINKREADQHVTDAAYDIILVDIDLREADRTASYQGDDWLKDHYESLQRLGIEIYIVTAQKDMIRDPSWIRSKNIPIIEKGVDEKAFYNKLRQRARARAPQVTYAEPPLFEFVTSSPEQQEVAKVILERTLGTFYAWIDRLPDADVKDLFIAGRAMSPSDVKREMRNPQSPVGSTMVSLFIDHVRDLLGFDAEDEQ